MGFTASKPESPPSPVTPSSQVGLPVKLSEPLSCTPVIAWSLSCGLTEMLNIWIVDRPELIGSSVVGTRLSQALQSLVSTGSRPRESHWLEMSLYVPLVRITPPSEPRNIWSGSPGTNAIAC